MCPHDSAFAIDVNRPDLSVPGHDPVDRGSAQLSRAASERNVLLRIPKSALF
jgi:hypothetical protein